MKRTLWIQKKLLRQNHFLISRRKEICSTEKWFQDRYSFPDREITETEAILNRRAQELDGKEAYLRRLEYEIQSKGASIREYLEQLLEKHRLCQSIEVEQRPQKEKLRIYSSLKLILFQVQIHFRKMKVHLKNGSMRQNIYESVSCILSRALIILSETHLRGRIVRCS